MNKLHDHDGMSIVDTEHSVAVMLSGRVLYENEYKPGSATAFFAAVAAARGFADGFVMLPWRPIEELEWQRYGDEQGFLILAPELVDGDCNVHGVGMGYFQDDRDAPYDEHGAIRDPESDDHYRERVLRVLSDEHPRYIDALTVTGAALDEIGALCGVLRNGYDGWLACKWSMQNDEWHEVPCAPTHYLRLRGVTND